MCNYQYIKTWSIKMCGKLPGNWRRYGSLSMSKPNRKQRNLTRKVLAFGTKNRRAALTYGIYHFEASSPNINLVITWKWHIVRHISHFAGTCLIYKHWTWNRPLLSPEHYCCPMTKRHNWQFCQNLVITTNRSRVTICSSYPLQLSNMSV